MKNLKEDEMIKGVISKILTSSVNFGPEGWILSSNHKTLNLIHIDIAELIRKYGKDSFYNIREKCRRDGGSKAIILKFVSSKSDGSFILVLIIETYHTVKISQYKIIQSGENFVMKHKPISMKLSVPTLSETTVILPWFKN